MLVWISEQYVYAAIGCAVVALVGLPFVLMKLLGDGYGRLRYRLWWKPQTMDEYVSELRAARRRRPVRPS